MKKQPLRQQPARPDHTLSQARKAYEGYLKSKDFKCPSISFLDFEEMLMDTRDNCVHAEQTLKGWHAAIDDRDKCLQELWDVVQQVRYAAKSTFGDDAPEMGKFYKPLVRFKSNYKFNLKRKKIKINKESLSRFFDDNGITDNGEWSVVPDSNDFSEGAKAYTDSRAGDSSDAIPYNYTAEQTVKKIDEGRKRWE